MNIQVSKIIILGDSKVGKTTFVKRLLNQNLNHEYVQTLGVEVDCVEIQNKIVNIWCCSGNINHNLYKYFNKSKLCIIMFDSTKHDNRIEYWIQYFRRYDQTTPIIICSSKTIDFTNLYYETIYPIFYINSFTNEGIQLIKQYISNI